MCVSGTSSCASNNFLSGYNAGSSYNLATGLGTIDIGSLVNSWTSVERTQTTTSLSVNPTTFQHGQAVAIAVGVNPPGATGNVAVTTNFDGLAGSYGNDSQTNYLLSSEQATGTWSGFPGGTYNVYANYSGDGTYASSVSAPTQVTVAPEDSIVQLSVTTVNSSGKLVSLAGGTVPYGSYISVDAQPLGQSQASNPNPIRNATGAVVFSDTGAGGGGDASVDASGDAELPVHYTVCGGPHAITATYIGDSSYNSSTSATISFTVQKGATRTSLTSTANSIYSGVLSLIATVSPAVPNHFSPALDGTLTFTDVTSNTVLATVGVMQSGNATAGYNGTAATDVEVTQLILGSNSIVATYNGGSNYAASASSAPVVVDCTAGCGNGTGQSLELGSYGSTPQSHIISPGTTSTTPVSVLAQGGFTGAVNLTCSVAGTNSGDVDIPKCSFNPATITIINDANSVGSTLTVTTTGTTASAAAVPANRLWLAAQGSLTFACLVFLGFSTRRRSLTMLRVVLCMVMIGGMMACGGGTKGNQGSVGGGGANAGTTPDTYTITFRAADAATGKLTAQDYFTLQVD